MVDPPPTKSRKTITLIHEAYQNSSSQRKQPRTTWEATTALLGVPCHAITNILSHYSTVPNFFHISHTLQFLVAHCTPIAEEKQLLFTLASKIGKNSQIEKA